MAVQAYLLERAGDSSAALDLLCRQLQEAAQQLLLAVDSGRVPTAALQGSLHFRAFAQARWRLRRSCCSLHGLVCSVLLASFWRLLCAQPASPCILSCTWECPAGQCRMHGQSSSK